MTDESFDERVERSDSIEVSQNGKKEFSFHVKLYFDSEKTNFLEITKRIDSIYLDLHKKFKQEAYEI